MKNNLNVIRR